MSNHRYSRPNRDFDESVFQPRSSFDFEEEARNFGQNMADFQPFSGEDLDFNLISGASEEDDGFDPEIFNGRIGPMAGSNPFMQNPHISNNSQTSVLRKSRTQKSLGTGPIVAEPPSAQNDIVNSRRDHVNQHFGQITPPNDDLLSPSKAKPSDQSQSQQSRSQESGKLTNEQRARNAANTRHSRTKSTKKRVDQQADSDGEDATKQGKNITLQREKNRIAAAKCRAKKKSANEQQEEMANEYSTTNNYLTREIRELKNQKTELQNFLLAHRPGVCECHGIHDYNFGQAQRLVLNARRCAVGSTSSPSRESAFSAQSPISEASVAETFSASTVMSPSEQLNMPQRYSSFGGKSSYAFMQDMDPDTMHNAPAPVRRGQHMSHEFAEFLQSSPGGRGGFS